MTEVIASTPRRAALTRRAAVTALLVVVFWALRWIQLPLLTLGDLRSQPWWVLASSSTQLSLGALGLTPFLWAFGSLGVVSRLSSALRWRLTPPTVRTAWALALVLAVVQAWGHVQWLASQRAYQRGTGLVPVVSGGLTSAAAAISLVAATALIGWLAWTITRRGLGDGFAVLLGATVLSHVASAVARGMTRSASTLPRPLLLTAACVALLVFTLRARPGRRPGIPLPTCSFLPLAVASWVFFLPQGAVTLVRTISPSLGTFVREDLPAHGDAGALILAVLLAPVFSLLLGARRAEAAWAAGDPALDANVVRRSVSEATRWSVLLVGLLAAAPFVCRFVKSHWILDAWSSFGLALLSASALDLVAEARARGRLGPLVPAHLLDDGWAVDPALAALEAAGIPATARSRYVHAVLRFLVPVEILVPEGRGDEAAEICARVGSGQNARPSLPRWDHSTGGSNE